MDLHHHHHGGEFQALVDAPPDPDETDHILHDANGNLEHLIQLEEGEEDAVVVYGHPQGARMGRVYKKGNWVVEEMLILQAAKREDVHRHSSKSSSSSASTPAQERWNWIEDYCWASGAHRSAQQCHDKWEVISTAYKKVHNNEKFGHKSYWNMTPEERKRSKLPPNFQKEIFTALLEWCNHKSNKNSDSGELVVNTSGPLGPSGTAVSFPVKLLVFIFERVSMRPTLMKMSHLSLLWGDFRFNTHASHADVVAHTGVKAELLDSEEESGEETSGPNQGSGKKRKAWSKTDEALVSILVRNNKNVVEAMLESEDRKDKRHREDLEMERVKLELEKEKFRGAMKLGSGYIDALVNIGDGLKQLSAALCANIHT